MRMLSTVCLFLFLAFAGPLRAQDPTTGTVTGVVTSEAGQPLASAQVSIPGTRRGTLTRTDGRYLITGVPAGQHQVRATLVGYAAQQQAVSVSAGATVTVNFRLVHSAVELEEIVAVGYGVQHRREVTGAVSSVSPARLENVPNTSVLQAMQAAAPGVNIALTNTGAEPDFSILIRGQNSITANNNPLIVVDGVPYNGVLSEINQGDIAAIDILKDASATAIYGARGANGVVLITTKRGQVGQPRFTYEGYVGMQDAVRLPRILSGPEFANFKCEHIWNLNETPCDEALTATERQTLESGQFTDWNRLATRTGTQQQHTLSFSGGSEETRFYFSGSALDTEGIALNDQFRRYTLRANLDHHVGTRIDAGFGTQLSHTDRSGLRPSFSASFYGNPLVPAFDEEGNRLITPWPEEAQRTNPLDNLDAVHEDLSRRALASSYVEVRLPFLEGLSYRFNGGIDFVSRDEGSYWGRNTRTGLNTDGRARTESQRFFDWTVENLLRYRQEFGRHTVDLTGLYSTQSSRFDQSFLQAEGFPNDVLTYRQAHVARALFPTHDYEQSDLISQMGRLNYGFAGRYLLTFTARRDGYSGFGDLHKFGVFPSVALAWNVSEEPFWNFDAFRDLKLRLSYGQNGNHAIRPYETLARLEEFTTYTGTSSAPGFKPETLGNPDLRWESTTSANLGLDFGFLAGRLQGSLDLYSSDTHDLLLERLISPVHGISRVVENIGSVRNRGIELALTGIPVQTPRFTWTADFNIAANRNKILELYGRGVDDLANQWFIGQPIRVHFGYVFDGVWQEDDDIANSAQPNARPGDARVLDLNGDGIIDIHDRTFLGSEDPDYIAGLTNTLRFGSFSVSAFLHSVQGVTRFSYDLLGDPLADVLRNVLYFDDWWTPENPSNTRWQNRQGANSLHVGLRQDASFIRLRDLMVSYDLPPALVGRVGASALRVYANGRNLWTHTKWPLLDPELSGQLDAARPPPPTATAALLTAGPHQRQVPLERVLSIGINASF